MLVEPLCFEVTASIGDIFIGGMLVDSVAWTNDDRTGVVDRRHWEGRFELALTLALSRKRERG